MGQIELPTPTQSPCGGIRISPQARSLASELGTLWRYRSLVGLLVRRNLVVVYKQTWLGLGWYWVTPFLSALVYALIFGELVGVATDGVPRLLFYTASVIFWNLFVGVYSTCQNVLLDNTALLNKVYFPRLALPVAGALASLYSFLVQLVVLIVIWLYYYFSGAELRPSPLLLYAPLALVQVVLLGMGCGLIVASLAAGLRDILYLSTFAVQLWMYVTPVVYPMSLVPERWRPLFLLNPLSYPLEALREGTTGVGSCAQLALWPGWLGTGLLLAAGLFLFLRIERNVVDRL